MRKKVNVGIDLGTTYSAVAVYDGVSDRINILKNDFEKEYTPSVVCIENGAVLIGEEAKNEQAARNMNTAAFYKSMMAEKDYEGNDFTITLDGDEYTPEQLSSIFLRELKQKIEEENNVEIENAIITVPAYFKEVQRNATMRAGQAAGLKVIDIINEPTAAIIAYGLTGGNKKKVLVYDLGGGTFDVTIAEINGTKVDVLTTNGNHQLGGKNWDEEIVKELVERFADEHGIDIRDYPEEMKKLQVTAEDVKKRLTKSPSTVASVSCEGITEKIEITRERFDERTEDLLNTTASLISQCFDDIGGGFGWHSLDEVVLVGGSTRMPQVKEYVMKEYGRAPITKNIDVDTIVAAGAAMMVYLRLNDHMQHNGLLIMEDDITDVASHSLGILVYNNEKDDFENSILIPKSSDYNKLFSKEYYVNNGSVKIYVLQGESEVPAENSLLYRYEIDCSSLRGQTKVSVGLCYNNSGVVEVKSSTEDGKNLKVSKVEVREKIDDVMAELRKDIANSRTPYTKWAGVSNIPSTSKDKYGNPVGDDCDLAADGAFEGYSILIINLCRDGNMNFSGALNALKAKGFKVDFCSDIPSNLKKNIYNYCQTWLISGRSRTITDSEVDTFVEYYNKGYGLYLWADNDPYFADINPISQKLFNTDMRGDAYGDKVMGIQPRLGEPGLVADHLITTGIVSFYEGITISSVTNCRKLTPLIYGSERQVVSAYSDNNGKRAILDGGFTRLYFKWDSAGTDRYVVNAAAWLTNIERHGYAPALK